MMIKNIVFDIGGVLADFHVTDFLAAKGFDGPMIKRILKELREAGYGVYYLSNYSRKAYYECGESLTFMPYMDGGIVSFRVGMTKPDPGMYEYVLKEYSLTAGECVFVDDMPENVDIARRLGFDGIVFEDEGKLREELGRRCVL